MAVRRFELRLLGSDHHQDDPGDKRQPAQQRRKRDGLLSVGAGLEGANVFLPGQFLSFQPPRFGFSFTDKLQFGCKRFRNCNYSALLLFAFCDRHSRQLKAGMFCNNANPRYAACHRYRLFLRSDWRESVKI